MPRAPKPKEIRQNTERVDIGDVPAGDQEPFEAPRPLRTWLASTKSSWERYWASPARHVTVASLDLDGIERLWNLYDERERAQRAIRAPQRAATVVRADGTAWLGKVIRGTDHRMIEGSEGQLRPNGLYNVMARLDAEIRQLEDRAGKSAKARLILGMRVGGDDAGRDPGNDDESDAARGAERADADALPPDPRLYIVERQAG